MTNSEIKKQLHNYIDMIEDESQLQMLNEAAKVYATKQQKGILDLLTPEQYTRFEQSVKEAGEGNFIPHEEVITISGNCLQNRLDKNCFRGS